MENDVNIAPCRISRGHCGLPLEGTTSRTYRLCMYVKTSKTLPFTLLLSLPLLFSLLLGPPRLLSFRYASTVAPRPRSSTTTTDPPIYLSYVRVSILDTRNAYVFPVRESRVPALYFSALSSLSLPLLFPTGESIPIRDTADFLPDHRNHLSPRGYFFLCSIRESDSRDVSHDRFHSIEPCFRSASRYGNPFQYLSKLVGKRAALNNRHYFTRCCYANHR